MDESKKVMRHNAGCRCEQPSANHADRTQTEWYKEMYCQIHKSPETKKVDQQNPYKPTYIFPKEFDGNLALMEDYIRKAASQHIDDDHQFRSSSPVRTSILHVKDHQTTPKRTVEKSSNFDAHYSAPKNSSLPDQIKSDNYVSTSSTTTAHPTTDDEQKSLYKRILRGGDIPSGGLQKFIVNNRDKPANRPNQTNEQTRISDDEIRELNSQKIETKSVSPTNKQTPKNAEPVYKALALYNFYAQSNRELSFKKGDTFLVKRHINDDWLEGEHQGLTGIFPLNHVELFPADVIEQQHNSIDKHQKDQQHEGEAIVKYDFVPQKTYELQLRKGEKVILLRRLDNNWYEGRLNNIEGIFPASYVETLREPPESKKSPEKVHSSDRIQSPIDTVPAMPKSVLKNPTQLQQTVVEKKNVVPESPSLMHKCQVLYDYTPENPDELEIHVGDIITIVEMCDDGWYCGLMEKSKYSNKMEFGTFPGNYVKLVPENE